MSDDGTGLTDSIARLPQRIAGLIELLTTLDTRVVTALDSLEEMRTSVSRFDAVGEGGDRLVADIEARMAALDEKLNRDMDELKAAVLAKLGELDLDSFGPRFDRLERALINVERATVNLDRNVEGALELLPDFMTRKAKREGRKQSAPPAADVGE
jgi:hypothetical protein